MLTADNVTQVIEQMKNMSVRKVAEIKKEIAISEHMDKAARGVGDAEADEVDDIGAAHQRLSFKLYPDQLKSVNDALVLAGKIGNSQCKNTQLRYIAEEFLSAYNTDDTERNRLEACVKFEKRNDVLILVANASNGKIIYGQDIEARLEKIIGNKDDDDQVADQPTEE